MEQNLALIWDNILKQIDKQTLNSTVFNTWFARMVLKDIDENGKKFYIAVPNNFIKGHVSTNERHMTLIKECIAKTMKDEYEPIIITNEEIIAPKIPPVLPETRLNPKYIFENFIVGKSNEFAHAAALAVAESSENPAEPHSNPLFIYGGVGLGKTHLMQAVGHFTLQQDPSKKVLYVTSEQFTNELINSIQTNRNEEFRNKYRKVDLLLIDDIQFIADKDRTQEEFFHTFNDLHEANKQIVLTSDKPPKEIKALEERLISRFAWGLVVDIGQPDLETRIAILRSKAESEGFDVPDNVINFIAENVRSNIRELEGALSRVMAYSKLTTGEITEETASIVLKDLFSPKKEKEITTELIKEVISKNFGVTIEELNSRKRTRAIAYPRQIAMYITRELTDLSLPRIGDEFGGRDHSTVIHAYDKIEKDMKEDTSFKIKINNLIKEIKE